MNRLDSLYRKIKASLSSVSGKGAFPILCGTFLTKLAAFLGSIVLVRVMSKGDYGVLSYMESMYTYAYLFAGYGLNNAVFRYLVLKETAAERKGIFQYVLIRGTLFNLVLIFILSIAAFLFPHSKEFSVASFMLPIMLLALPFQFAYDTCSFSLRALFLNRAYAIAAIVAIALVWSSKVVGANVAGLDGAVLAWPVAYGVMSAALFFYFKKHVFPETDLEYPGKNDRRDIRSYSLQYMVTNGLWAVFLQNDLLMIGLLTADAAAVADYKIAYAIPAAIAILSSAVGMFVSPYFVKNEKRPIWVWRNYKRTLLITVCIVGAAAFITFLAGSPMISFLFGDRYADIIPLMNILLIVAFVTNGLRYPTANLLAAMGKIRVNMVVSICGVLAQVALNLFFIPLYGTYGAAFTSIIVYTFMATSVFVAFIRLYRPRK